MRRTLLAFFVLATTALLWAQQPTTQKRLRVADIYMLPFSPADHRLAYGNETWQYGELRLPAGQGPYPVAIIIHGGCWERKFADLHIMDPMATTLTRAGVATWNLEYRSVDQDGGAWPGMFQDVGAGVDFLRSIAARYHLDLKRVLVMGHSAGGHLALWVAARPRVPKDSPIFSPSPLPVKAAISLDGIDDLEWVVKRKGNVCGDVVLDRLVGSGDKQADNLRAASPAALLPLGVPETLLDSAVTMPWATPDEHRTFAEQVRKSGDQVTFSAVEGVGHFEFIAPGSIVWPRIEKAVVSQLK